MIYVVSKLKKGSVDKDISNITIGDLDYGCVSHSGETQVIHISRLIIYKDIKSGRAKILKNAVFGDQYYNIPKQGSTIFANEVEIYVTRALRALYLRKIE